MKQSLKLRDHLSNAFLAAVSSYGALLYLSQFSEHTEIRGSALSIILFVCFCILWNKPSERADHKSDVPIHLIFSFLFSCALVFGSQLRAHDTFLQIKQGLFNALFVTFAAYPVSKYAGSLLYGSKEWISYSKDDKKAVRIAFSVIAVVWFCVWLANWPGVFGYDGTFWYYALDQGHLRAKFSIPYQLIFYGLIKLGYNSFGNYEIGFSVFTLLQMSYVLWVIYRIIEYVYEETGRVGLYIGTAFFVLNLPLSILSMSSAQDAPFMAAFSMCVLLFVKLGRDPEAFWKSKKNAIKLALWLLMLFFWRNNGLYALVFTAMIAVIGIRHYKKELLIVLGCAVLVFEIYCGPVLTALGADKSTTLTEMMSVPATQLTYVWNFSRDKLSADDLEALYRYIPQDFLEGKNFIDDDRISDNYKKNLNVQEIKSDPVAFARFYLRMGIKCPKDYLIAHMDLTYGMWYPDVQYYDHKMYHPYIEASSTTPEYLQRQNPKFITTLHSSKLPFLKSLIEHLFGEASIYNDTWRMEFNSAFLISNLYKFGLYFWAVLYVLIYSAGKKLRCMNLPLSLTLGLLFTVFLGPVILFRYISPVMLSLPVLLSAFIAATKAPKDV